MVMANYKAMFTWYWEICTLHSVYREPSTFLHTNIFCLHETGYFEIVLRACNYSSDIYHVTMRRYELCSQVAK